VEVPAKKIPYFKPSKELKDLINHAAAEMAAQAQQAASSTETPPA
jgi:integration host factor subunit beta